MVITNKKAKFAHILLFICFSRFVKMKQAFIMIDIQNDYFEGGANPLVNTGQAAENAKKLLEYFRESKLPIIHIKHLATRPDATFFIPDTHGAEIYQTLQHIDGEKVIVKNYPNSFRNTDLLEYLKGLDVEELVICGMMTHMCVDATVRAAKDFGFNCKLVADACATKDLEIHGNTVKAEDVQLSFLAALNYFYAEVINTESIVHS